MKYKIKKESSLLLVKHQHLIHTLFDEKIPNNPTLFLILPADMVPLTVTASGFTDNTGWMVGVWCIPSGRLRSSNGKSDGGSNPDLYLSITKSVS